MLTNSPAERQVLVETLFDEVKTDLATDFNGLMQLIIPVFKQLMRVKNAQIVGKSLNDMDIAINKALISQTIKDNCFIYAAFVKPGKHSIFIYEPVLNKFY